MTITDYFPNMIGQTEAVSKLSFYLQGYEKTRVFPNLCITGTRGFGKSMIAQGIARNLFKSEEEGQGHKRMVEISGAEFAGNKALKQFIESVIINYVQGFQEVTLFFDEIHLAHDSVKNWLLHVLNPTDGNVTRNSYEDTEYEFDFKKFTFLSATTNPEKMSKPLLDRLERIELRPYKQDELIKLLRRYTPDVNYKDDIEGKIVSTMRGNPRQIVKFAKQKLPHYMAQMDKDTFDALDWTNLCQILSIRPYGLLPNEIEALRYLELRGGATLTSLAAFLGLDPATVRRESELFLLSNNLIRIDGKRYITPQGQKVLKECLISA